MDHCGREQQARLMLHPAVRVAMLLVVAFALPSQSLAVLLSLGAAVLVLHLIYAAHALQRLLSGVWRIKWLLLAIFILYGGFTPGTPLAEALPGISREGLLEGSRRALVLVDLLIMVYLLLALTPIPELVLAIRWWLRPLQLVGVAPERVGLRIALALDGVGAMQQRWRDQRTQPTGDAWARAADWIAQIEQRAQQPLPPLTLPPLAAPAGWQWLLPLMLALGFWIGLH